MKQALLMACALGLSALAGCTQADKTQIRQDVKGVRQQIGSAAESAQQAAAETSLAAKVKAALGTRKGLNGSNIDVKVNGSAVTLTGDVASREQAEQAERVATETEGVGSVDNQLTMRIPAITPSTPAPRAAPAAAPSSPSGY
jgi:osmotically-inducible protein OsmY